MDLVERVKRILMQPQAEWQTIAGEVATTQSLYMSYIIPLAAIRPVAWIIGMSIVGMDGFRLSIGSSFAQAVVLYVLTLAGVYGVAFIIDALALNFSGQKNMMQALKVSAYASTASWLGGILFIIPSISIIGSLAGLYSIYLLYLGMPALMKAPKEKAVAYTVVVVIAAVAVFVLIGVVMSGMIPYSH